MYFCKIKNLVYGEMNEQSFSNPHPDLTQFLSSEAPQSDFDHIIDSLFSVHYRTKISLALHMYIV